MLTKYEDFINEIVKYPNGKKDAAYQKIKDLVDLKKMYEEDTIFFNYLVQTIQFHEVSTAIFTVSLYNEIKLLSPNIGSMIQSLVSKKIKDINEHILNLDLSKPRIKNISEYRIETIKRNEKSVSYEFSEITDEIEELYDIDTRGIYSNVLTCAEHEILQNEFGFTKEQIEISKYLPPILGDKCARLMCALGSFVNREEIKHKDHWHHLLNQDFIEFRRGGINYMSMYFEDDNYIKECEIYKKIREIYTIECKADGFLNGETIPFHIDW